MRWPQSTGADNYRRGLYIFRQRTLPYPQLETFDAPDTVQVVCKRDRSTTPLQALTLLNDPVFVEAARALAGRVLREAGTSVRERIRHAFRLCLAREPDPHEVGRLLDYFEQQRRILSDEARAASQADSSGSGGLVGKHEGSVWAAVGSVLLNLAEFLTRT